MQSYHYVHPNQQQNDVTQMSFPWENPKLLSDSDLFPSYFRSVSQCFPGNSQTYEQCKLPMGLVVSPGMAGNVETVDYSKSSIPRCSGCHGYIGFGAKVMKDGKSWKCPICDEVTQISNVKKDDNSSIPLKERKEFNLKVYDILVPDTKIYRKQNIEPCFLFLIDMSYNSVISGFTRQMLSSIKACLNSIPDYYKIGLVKMTNVASVFDLETNSEIVFPDLQEKPLNIRIKNTIMYKKDCVQNMIKIIDWLLEEEPDENIIGNCFGDGLTLADQLLKENGGIIIAGFTGLPKYGFGLLNPRNGDELTLLKLPSDSSGKFYRTLAFQLNNTSISVYAFTAGNDFKDLSVVGVPSGLTCGRLFNYGTLDNISLQQMHSDLFKTLTNHYLWEVSMKLRYSRGIKFERAFTNCIIKTGEIISLPVIESDGSIVYKLKTIGNTPQQVVFQLAFIFTDDFKNKKIRVFTFSMPSSTNLEMIKNHIDEAALISIFTKSSVAEILNKGPNEGNINIKKEFTSMLKSNSQFISLKYLIHSLVSNIAIRNFPHPLGVDGRMTNLILLRSINAKKLLLYLYPRMFLLDSKEFNILPLTGQSFYYGNCFLIHTIDKIYIWVNQNVSKEYLKNVFGVNSFDDEMPLNIESLNINNPEYQKLKELINNCWEFNGNYLPTEIIKQGEPRESIFSEILVDDSEACGSNLQKWINEFKSF